MNHIVLYQPEIPQNTGNIMRTCVGFDFKLHLIKPLGFSLDEKNIKRSGANYIHHTDYKVYEDFDDFLNQNEGDMFFITRYGFKQPSDHSFVDNNKDIYLIFGSESSGMPKALLANHIDKCIRVPMTEHVRSLNLSNVVALMAYEVIRQQDYPHLYKEEPDSLKGSDYLLREDE
jgi:tRNA (cytidine/uridine-2'-O-)-methyltransferase